MESKSKSWNLLMFAGRIDIVYLFSIEEGRHILTYSMVFYEMFLPTRTLQMVLNSI